MKRQPRILAGTAIGLLMASAPLGAYPLQGNAAFGTPRGASVILAQANCAEGQSADDCAQGGQRGEAEQPRRKKHDQQQETAPAGQAAPSEQEQKPRKRQAQEQMNSGQSGEAAPTEQQQKPRRKHDQQQMEAAPADQDGAPAANDQQANPRKKKRDQQQQIEAAPADQGGAPAANDQQVNPRKKKREQQQIEAAPAGQGGAPAAGDQQVNPRKKKRDQQQQIETAPADQGGAAATDQQQGDQGRKKRRQQGENMPAEQAKPSEQTAPANDNGQGGNQDRKKHRQGQSNENAPAGQAPTGEQAPAKTPAPAGGAAQQAEPSKTGEQAAPAQGEQPQDRKKQGRRPQSEQPAAGEQPATGEQPANGNKPANNNQPANGGAAQGEAPANSNETPLLDSQKDAARRHHGGQNDNGATGNGQGRGQGANGQAGNGQSGTGLSGNGQDTGQAGRQRRKPAPVDQGPPPTDDRAAQQEIRPEKILPVTEEKGKRVDLTPQQIVRDRRRPQGADVLKQFGDRVIVQFNNQTIVESNEAPRITRGAKDVYYEDLPRGRIRETVMRDNGVRIVTIRTRNGDVVQRSRVMPDGREYVLSYVDERYYNDVDDWRDPGDDLPPMRLDMPRRDYILDSEDVESPDDYYTFLEQPPVERVRRLYSIDEVKRSARVRDIARRIDLDTLNFDFGSATISDAEVQKLDGVAAAMEKLLKKNPAETFLIEGHTDAVGTPDANLALSDRRAEAVAEALTNAFGIPAENLATQGYGEEYLKVNTPGPNRENRRVAIRRITSLVAPVASNNEQ